MHEVDQLINSIAGSMSIAGTQVGTLSTGDLGSLEGKGVRTLKMPLTINFLSAGSAVAAAINGRNANLKFDAHLKSGEDQVPLKVDQLVNFVH